MLPKRKLNNTQQYYFELTKVQNSKECSTFSQRNLFSSQKSNNNVSQFRKCLPNTTINNNATETSYFLQRHFFTNENVKTANYQKTADNNDCTTTPSRLGNIVVNVIDNEEELINNQEKCLDNHLKDLLIEEKVKEKTLISLKKTIKKLCDSDCHKLLDWAYGSNLKPLSSIPPSSASAATATYSSNKTIKINNNNQHNREIINDKIKLKHYQKESNYHYNKITNNRNNIFSSVVISKRTFNGQKVKKRVSHALPTPQELLKIRQRNQKKLQLMKYYELSQDNMEIICPQDSAQQNSSEDGDEDVLDLWENTKAPAPFLDLFRMMLIKIYTRRLLDWVRNNHGLLKTFASVGISTTSPGRSISRFERNDRSEIIRSEGGILKGAWHRSARAVSSRIKEIRSEAEWYISAEKIVKNRMELLMRGLSYERAVSIKFARVLASDIRRYLKQSQNNHSITTSRFLVHVLVMELKQQMCYYASQCYWSSSTDTFINVDTSFDDCQAVAAIFWVK